MSPPGVHDATAPGSGAPEVSLESSLPPTLAPGAVLAIYCSGSAWDIDRPVAALRLLVDGIGHPVAHVRMPRFDLAQRRSGWWAIVPVRAGEEGDAVRIDAELTLRDGSRHRAALAQIPVVAADEAPAVLSPADGAGTAGSPADGGGTADSPAADRGATADSPAADGAEDLVAICMATFDPDPDLLRAQIESIRAQSYPRWVCVISDDWSSPHRYADLEAAVGEDRRFFISRAPGRIGFYRNFERALRLAPPQAPLIALCDQDDVWHPDKLRTLRDSIGAASLVYSDQRLVDERGRVLRETMWRGRSNNSTNLASMLIANTVTGAASMFTRSVGRAALPFPDSPGIEFHDHWVALVALASGRLAYVDRPLYDYVQHSGAILGKVTEASARAATARGRGRGWLRAPRMREWRAAYFLGYVPGAVRARTLLLRCGDRMTPSARRALERYLRCEDSPAAFLWFVLRPVRLLDGRTETLGGEWELAFGILWSWAARLAAWPRRWPQRWTLDTRFPDPPHFEQKRLRRWRERI